MRANHDGGAVRKPITRVNGYASSNSDDKDAILTVLLKRVCSFEEAADYLLSAIPEIHKDDMMGELLTWEANPAEMRRIRDEQRMRSDGPAKGTEEIAGEEAFRMKEIRVARANGMPLREIAWEHGISVDAVRRLLAKGC